jgi:hypothetical protein
VVDESAFGDALEPQEIVPFDAVDETLTAAKKPDPPPVAPPPPQVPFPRIDAVAGDAAPPLKTRRRPRPADDHQQTFGMDLPEFRVPSFGGNDEEAIMPDPPPPRATYEDNDGPPLPL